MECMVSEEIIFEVFSFSIFLELWFSWQPLQTSSWLKYMAETRLFKDYFCKSYVKISAVA